MGKTQAVNLDSIDDLLASIRQTIHEEDTAPVGAAPSGARGFHRPSRDLPRAPRPPASRAGVGPKSAEPVSPGPTHSAPSKRPELGGVRLEEALARLSRAGRMPPVSPQDLGSAPLAAEQAAELRPSLVEMGERVEMEEIVVSSTGEASHRPADASFGNSRAQAQVNNPAANGHVLSLFNLKMESAPDLAAVLPQAPELMSAETNASMASAFHRLAETLLKRSSGTERAVEDLTRDMLRPLLKSWLDEHLPGIVERLVREEIERVARRGGR